MTTFKKEEITNKKEEFLRLMSEYFDAMIEYDAIKGVEIQYEISKLLPIDLIIDYNTDVVTFFGAGKNRKFRDDIIKRYNEVKEDESQ